MYRFPASDSPDIAAARRGIASDARRAGFGEVDEGRVALVTTELVANLVRHGGGGELLWQWEEDGTLAVLALDRGPGMADLQACLRDGYSTGGTPGTGLGAIHRLSEQTEIWSRPGLGTAVLVRLRQQRRAPARTGRFRIGAVCLAKAGEEVCGDAWAFAAEGDRAAMLVADGLGHGPQAAAAAAEAVRLFRKAPLRPPQQMLEDIHAGLRPTRGAAISLAQIQPQSPLVTFAGIGNVLGTLAGSDGTKRMIAMEGTAGHVARRIQPFTYDAALPALVVMCSDGLASSWTLDRYPGLAGCDPLLVAGLLYRDHSRQRDDVTVAVLAIAP